MDAQIRMDLDSEVLSSSKRNRKGIGNRYYWLEKLVNEVYNANGMIHPEGG